MTPEERDRRIQEARDALVKECEELRIKVSEFVAPYSIAARLTALIEAYTDELIRCVAPMTPEAILMAMQTAADAVSLSLADSIRNEKRREREQGQTHIPTAPPDPTVN